MAFWGERQFAFLPEIDLPYAHLTDNAIGAPDAPPATQSKRVQQLDAEVQQWIERINFRGLRTAVTDRWAVLHGAMRSVA